MCCYFKREQSNKLLSHCDKPLEEVWRARGIEVWTFTLCHPELVSGYNRSQAENIPLTPTLSRKGRGRKDCHCEEQASRVRKARTAAGAGGAACRHVLRERSDRSDEAIQLIYNQESGSKSKALLNDESHTSRHPYLQTSELAPTQPSLIREGEQAAFTLAEVLITLGIIGVVAAMTLPTLTTKIQEQRTVAQLKKAYNILENAYQRMITDYGPIDTWDLIGYDSDDYYLKDESGNFVRDTEGNKLLSDKANDSKDLFNKRFRSYLKINSFAKQQDIAQYYLNGQLSSIVPATTSKPPVILSDGTGLSNVWIGDSKCKMVYGSSKMLKNGCGDFYVILNPGSNKRTYGKDFFKFIVTKYGIVPSGGSQFLGNDGNMKNCLSKHSWSDCTGWVIYQGNMDYLHCDDLSWDGKTKCK